MAEIRYATCSWKYDSWKGFFYPEKPGNINFLKEYSKHLNSVEIDQWFWSLGKTGAKLPKYTDVLSYRQSVNKDFRFSVKMPNSLTLTHHYNLSKTAPLINNDFFLSNELTENFLSSISEIKENLGPLMFQFEYLNKLKMPSQNDFIDQFTKYRENLTNEFLWGIEIRNPNYLNKKHFEFIKSNNLLHVFLQGYYMPPIFDVYSEFRDYIQNSVVIRLHGPDRKGIEKITKGEWKEIVLPKDEEIEKLIVILKDLLNRDIDVYLNVNNHYEGCAPKTITKIKDLLKNN